MAASDATAFPVKNQAYRVTFPILDADGDLVPGATGLDSEISKDGGTFTDCTNEATEIATASGIYFLDITATEMDCDTAALIVKTTSAGAKTTALVLYPGGPIQVADEILVRDWTAITRTPAARSVWNALRLLRNLWTLTGGNLTVKKEDDSTTAWTATVTSDAAAEPITGVDPA